MPRPNYEVVTTSRQTVEATASECVFATPIGEPCRVGVNGNGYSGTVLSIGKGANPIRVIDIGRQLYRHNINFVSAATEGQVIFYNVSATATPWLTTTSNTGANPPFGRLVLGDDDDAASWGIGTREAVVEQTSV